MSKHKHRPQPPAPKPLRPPSGKRRLWLMRAAFMIVSPLAALLLIEGALRLSGYGYPTSFFIQSRNGALISNQKFGLQFFSPTSPLKPFLFTLAPTKPPGTIRICILGESAAMGAPDPAFGFGRILEIMLRRAYPGRRFEVINAAMRGINSHIVRFIARDCAQYDIDYFVIYMGNNEVVGFHSPHPDSPRWSQSLTLIRAVQCLRSSRLGQFLVSVGYRIRPPLDEAQPQDMPFFRNQRIPGDDWRRDAVADNFRGNLEDICRAVTSQSSKVVLATVAVNLKDCPPLASLHRPALTPADRDRWDNSFQKGNQLESQGLFSAAAAAYESAGQIDDHFAELQFRLARCYRASRDDRARRHYELAWQWDALQFRPDTRLNPIIRTVATQWRDKGILLADAEKAFADSPLNDQGLPGAELFNDHVHPTFAGAYLLAQTVHAQLAPALEQSHGLKPQGPIPTLQECSQAVPYTVYDDINVQSAFVGLTARPPFLDQLDHAQRQRDAEDRVHARLMSFSPEQAKASLKAYKAVINLEPDYWPARFNLANLYEDIGRYPPAVEQLQRIVQDFPDHSAFRMKLAHDLFKSGNKPAAIAQLRESLRRNPSDKSIQSALTQLDHPTH